jgi:hypothetical protein
VTRTGPGRMPVKMDAREGLSPPCRGLRPRA